MSKEIIRLTTPLDEYTLQTLRIGDLVSITGVMYTARDAAHKRIVEAIENGSPLPFDVRGQIIYYVGPTPARPGEVIGSAGPTTSYRMDAYAPTLIALGLRGMIGKGKRSAEVVQACVRHKAVYFAAIGGAGAFIGRSVRESQVIAYDDLGAEAVRSIFVEDFRAIVANDTLGSDIYEEGYKAFRRQLPDIEIDI